MGCTASRGKVKPKPPRLELPQSEGASLLRPATASTAPSALASPVIRWKRGHLIAQGAYGSVHQALNVDTGQIYALKRLTLSPEPAKRQKEITKLRREFLTLQELSHENLLKYLQVDVEPDQSAVNLVLEYAPGGSVLSILSRTQQCEEGMIRQYTRQLLQGVAYLHRQGVIHRDIKCSNILVDASGKIKIADFGSCRRVATEQEESTSCTSLAGSPYWMAPEVTRRIGHSFPADIWSVGCAVIEMISRRAPWSDISTNSKEVLQLISRTQSAPAYPSAISVECRAFLDCCLQVNPDRRATADQLLTHCFITGSRINTEELRSLDWSRPESSEFLPQISLKSKFNSPVLKSTKTRRANVFFCKSLLASPKLSSPGSPL